MARITQQSSIGTTGTSFENEPIVKSDGASSDVMEWAASTGSSAIKVTEGADNKLDLTVDGKPVVAGVQSDGAGLHFDGAAGGISLGTSMPDLGTKYSLEFVVKGDSKTGETYLLDAYKSGARIIFGWSGYSNGNIQLHINGTWSSSFMATPDNGEVVHLVLSVDGTSATLYQNGNSVSTQTVVANTMASATSTHIGSSQNGTANFFNGTIYRARFYNHTLSADEVRTAFERADVDYSSQYGSQTSKILNGTSWTGASGSTPPTSWTAGVAGTFTIDSSSGSGSEPALKIARNGTNNFPYIYQTFTSVVGKKYRVKYRVKNVDATSVKVGIGSSAVAEQYNLSTYTSTSWADYEETFTATTTVFSVYVQALTSVGTQSGYIDSLTVEQVGAVVDMDLAFANPTQSLAVQDRSTNNVDGTCSASGVTQVQPVVQLNSTSARIGTTQATPADGDIVATGQIKTAGGALATPSFAITNEAGLGMSRPTSNTLNFITASTERMRIDGSGNVGIGQAPTANFGKLQVYATGDQTDETTAAFSIGDTATGGMRLFGGVNNTTNYAYIGAVESGTAYRDLLLQPNGGLVGIGTGAVSPLAKLNVKGTQGNWRIDPDSVSAEIQALATNQANDGFIDYRLRANQVIFDTSGSPRLTISATGDITSTNSTTAKPILTLENTTADAASSQLVFNKNRTATNDDILGTVRFKGNNNAGTPENIEYATIYAQSSTVTDGAEDGQLIFRTMKDGTLAPRLTIASNGVAEFSNGIAFNQTNSDASGVSDDSTTLSHYESGTWSPKIYKGTTEHTGASVYGKYVRIGNLVWVSFYILKTSGSESASGTWGVKGLPFPVKEAAPAGHQSIPSNYFQLNGTNYFNASPHRWQANEIDELKLYGTHYATTWSSGTMEFAGTGVLHIDY